MPINYDRSAWPTGFYIGPKGKTASQEQIDAFSSLPVANIGDCMGRSTGTIGLKVYHGDIGLKIAGSAVTVRVRPGDNLMIHKAIELAEAGNVIVVDGGGDLSQALMGGLMRATMITKGISGVVLNGAIRDVEDWAQGIIGAYALGHTFRGPSKDGPGEINVPVSCAGLVVEPGDLIIGDGDGVIAVPVDRIDSLLPQVQTQHEREQKTMEANRQKLPDPERFNSVLRKLGCPL